jgi:hypothetical protein
MVRTTRVKLDRIASSTRNARLAPDVIVGDDIVARESYILAVRILDDTDLEPVGRSRGDDKLAPQKGLPTRPQTEGLNAQEGPGGKIRAL